MNGITTDVFVAVHAGAGSHSQSNENVYKSVCKLACQQAMELLREKKSALEAVTAAVKVLEDDICTNAGQGSNLTMQGTVECDASIMDGRSLCFGAVGALSGVANPVTVAGRLIDEQMEGPLPCGRVRPSVLVGQGAQDYCAERGFDISKNLISDGAFKAYNRYKRRYQEAELKNEGSAKRRKVQNDASTMLASSKSNPAKELLTPTSDCVQDTVGAVCVDHEGNVAAASSSGGIWLKHSGRLGPAAVYGAGCWAENEVAETKPGIAAVTSGCGEHLIRTILAKTCSDAIRTADDLSQSLGTVFQDRFLRSEFLVSEKEKFGGALILRTTFTKPLREVEVSWVHSTSSMSLAYMAGNKKIPTVVISRLDERCLPGQSYVMGGHQVAW